MSEQDEEKLMALVREKRHKIKLDTLEEQHRDELNDQHAQHRRELKQAKLEAENEALRSVLAVFVVLPTPTPSLVPATPSTPPITLPPHFAATTPVTAAVARSGMTFKEVVDGFLKEYESCEHPAMLKKHQLVLPMLLEIVGDKPIADIRQADIKGYFALLQKLPPKWTDTCEKEGLSVRQLSELEHDVTIGPGTFKGTYITCVRAFLNVAKRDWQDEGFPTGLTTVGIKYSGSRKEKEEKQRAFKPEELKRLFEGPEIKSFAADASKARFYWLPHIGLYTGARVNEICQLNPQTDILKDPETGVLCFWISEETEGDPRIVKSVKTGEARKVPIHKHLIELGFMDYVERVKSTGAKLLFPGWNPINQRASTNAEKWFRKFLRDTGLRDDTPNAKILGMHAFRHTLLTYGTMQKPQLSLVGITGHAQKELPATGAARGYFTVSLISPLSDKAELLNKLDYGLCMSRPVGT